MVLIYNKHRLSERESQMFRSIAILHLRVFSLQKAAAGTPVTDCDAEQAFEQWSDVCFSLALAFPDLGVRLMMPGQKMPPGFDMLRWELGPTDRADPDELRRVGSAPPARQRRKARQ